MQMRYKYGVGVSFGWFCKHYLVARINLNVYIPLTPMAPNIIIKRYICFAGY